MNWLLALLLIGAAVVAARPGSAARERLLGPRTWIDVSRLRRAAASAGPRLTVAAIGVVTVVAGVVGGPVGAFVAVAYAGLGAHEWDRSRRRRQAGDRRGADLDEVAHLVAELRAGIPPVIVAASRTRDEPQSGPSERDAAPRSDGRGTDARIQRLTAAVWRLAECTGAPAADLLERIERDAREADRAARSAGAQAAGAQTTAVLLTGLPGVGIGMGYLIGGDPVDVLLYTPWGAACAVGAVVLQIAGLKWSQRLTAPVTA
ncbi:MAG TPA: hypothetical protein VN408_28490 [Actinoplanes sp.]|nr:hypothetical protein [Actinoplanes sp.]